MNRYFISYLSMNGPASTFGNMEITLPRPITSMNDIAQVTAYLRREHGLTNVAVMSFTRFEDNGDAR